MPNSKADSVVNAPPEADPPGFALRRVRNWFFLGLTYASYYLCRYNLGAVAPELMETLKCSKAEYGMIDSARNWCYAVGQFVNGLFTDKLGGKQAMTIGAVGTIILNVAFGLTAWSNIVWIIPALIIVRGADGYVQAFGAPGMVKINTAWFRRRERGFFAGIFGAMINLGQTGVGQLAPMLAKGFAVPLLFFTFTMPAVDWRYMFIVPPCVVVVIVILMNLTVKNQPEEAGYHIVHDDEAAEEDPQANLRLADVFRRITSNKIVWIVAGAYFCTGFVRTAIYAWYAVYLEEAWNIEKTGPHAKMFWWFAAVLLPTLATVGSLSSGIISDLIFKGRRAPVAAVLYLLQVVFVLLAMAISQGAFQQSALLAIVVLLGIHTGCNATHSILGTAAAMDLGGRKMAGFAAGVIDSFQYFGAGLAGVGLGWLLDKSETTTDVMNPTVWFASMLPWALLGTCLMTYLWWTNRGKTTAGA